MASFCLTEPEAGTDANACKTAAVLSKDGKTYTITGKKLWVTNAYFADIYIVFARIEDDKYITCFIVERRMAGIEIGPEENKMGIHSCSTREIYFNHVKVPAANMLGGRGNGLKLAMNALNVSRVKICAALLESCRSTITLSVEYAN